MAPNSFILLEQFLAKQVITKVATNQLPDSRNQYQKKPTSGGEDDMVPNSFILPPRAVLTRRNHQKVRDKSTAWLSESIAKNSPWAVAATMWYLWIWGGHGTKSLHPPRNPISGFGGGKMALKSPSFALWTYPRKHQSDFYQRRLPQCDILPIEKVMAPNLFILSAPEIPYFWVWKGCGTKFF